MKRYKVDFYDAFDGWTTKGFPAGFYPDREFDDLEKLKDKHVVLHPEISKWSGRCA